MCWVALRYEPDGAATACFVQLPPNRRLRLFAFVHFICRPQPMDARQYTGACENDLDRTLVGRSPCAAIESGDNGATRYRLSSLGYAIAG
jgi:hypothetical protein